MTIPFELADTIVAQQLDPNSVIVGRSYYYADASPVARLVASNNNQLIEYDEHAVAGQIEIVLGTPLGTEPFEPTFGSRVLELLFDNMSPASIAELELEALTALRKWLGNRLDFFSVNVNTLPDNGDVIVTIPFRIKVSGVSKAYIGNLTAMQKVA